MSTFTPGACAVTLTSPSVTTVTGEALRFPSSATFSISAPEPVLSLSLLPSPVAISASPFPAQSNRSYPAGASTFSASAPSVSVSVGAGPNQTKTPGVAFFSLTSPSPAVRRDQFATASATSLTVLAPSVSVIPGVRTVVPSPVAKPLAVAVPAVVAVLDVFPDPVPLSVFAGGGTAGRVAVPDPVAFVVEPAFLPSFFQPDSVTVEPDPVAFGPSLPFPGVLLGERVLSVGLASLSPSVPTPVVREGQGETWGYCLLTKTAEATCLLNVSSTVHSETEPE